MFLEFTRFPFFIGVYVNLVVLRKSKLSERSFFVLQPAHKNIKNNLYVIII